MGKKVVVADGGCRKCEQCQCPSAMFVAIRWAVSCGGPASDQRRPFSAGAALSARWQKGGVCSLKMPLVSELGR